MTYLYLQTCMCGMVVVVVIMGRLSHHFSLHAPRHVPRLVLGVHDWFQNGLPGIGPDVVVRGLQI